MSINSKNGEVNNQFSAKGLVDFQENFKDEEIALRLKEAAPSSYEAAAQFWQAGLSSNALSPRMKELVLLALHATVTALDTEAIQRHVDRALAAGASEQDIMDVLLTIVGVANHALYFAVPILMRELEHAGHPQAALPAISPQAQEIKDEFIRTRGFWNEQRDIIVRMMPAYFASLAHLSTESWKNGTLTDKERELVCIAIDCSVTHMYEPGLVIHIRNALSKGASRDEILAVFNLASLTGLEGYILGANALFRSNAMSEVPGMA